MTEQAAIKFATSWMLNEGFDRVECAGADYIGPNHGYETVVKLRDEGRLDIGPDILEYLRLSHERAPTKPYWLVYLYTTNQNGLSLISLKVDDASGETTHESFVS
jgi:hypothetical protein